ncbi:two-component system response regulator MprA [Nocardioides aromaticivorans]|uniref:Two-component system response regulator MprA n=1 Tax=Nocardioides aromaticivorans TaxID=200618 RepID=A0A7Y9ZFC8_9ACTN|nr:response regulator transcription factor [Nocardioides aromaticivorans]NYI44394.1 two-component system response regulator MprA [Nocardioides aromaticivorans]
MDLTVGICEDDPALRRALRGALTYAGHDAVVAHNGTEALSLFATADLDVIIMDVGLPDADGRDVCQALKARGQAAPVLFLTALGAVHDRLAGFSAGGDDYVAKPFDVKELLARVAVLGRRGRQLALQRDDSGLVLDPATHALRTDSGEVLLSPTEFRMLAAVAARPGDVVRRAAVIAAAWPDGAIVSDNTVDSLMRRVRAKLVEADAPALVETVRGVGYRLGARTDDQP